MQALEEILQVSELPMINPLDFIGKEFIHVYEGVSIKTVMVESLGDDKIKVNSSQ